MGAVVVLGVTVAGTIGVVSAQDDPPSQSAPSSSADANTDSTSTESPAPRSTRSQATFAADHTVDDRAAKALPDSGELEQSEPEMTPIYSFLEAPTTVDDAEAQSPRDEKPAAEAPAAAADDAPVVGPAAEQLANLKDEYAREGWRQVGTPEVIGTPTSAPIDIDGKPGLRVTACLDDSSVKVVAEDGREVQPAASDRRALNTFDLYEDPESGWVVVATGFPSDPRC